MKTLVQKVFGNSITGKTDTLSIFPNSKLQEVSKELHKKLEAKRAAELTDDQKIAMEIAALRVKARHASRQAIKA